MEYGSFSLAPQPIAVLSQAALMQPAYGLPPETYPLLERSARLAEATHAARVVTAIRMEHILVPIHLELVLLNGIPSTYLWVTATVLSIRQAPQRLWHPSSTQTSSAAAVLRLLRACRS